MAIGLASHRNGQMRTRLFSTIVMLLGKANGRSSYGQLFHFMVYRLISTDRTFLCGLQVAVTIRIFIDSFIHRMLGSTSVVMAMRIKSHRKTRGSVLKSWLVVRGDYIS